MDPIDRRDFLARTLSGLSTFGVIAQGLSVRTPAWLRTLPEGERILLVIELGGGNDGLNVLVPFGADEYHKARPTLGLAARQCLELTPGLGLPADLKGMKALYDAGKLALIQGVGYPNPNRSHFKSMDIWHSADPSTAVKVGGWLGRTVDELAGGKRQDEAIVNLGLKPALALQGGRCSPIAFQDPASYRFVGSEAEARVFAEMARSEKNDTEKILEIIGRTAETASTSSDRIRAAASGYKTPVAYPDTRLAGNLRTVASLIQAGLQTRVFYAYHNGFDTHTNQQQRHPRLLQELDGAVAAFQKDLERLGFAQRVATLVFSEFGRRVAENASRGTDHGAAGPVFLLGGRVRGGLHGQAPSLADLDRGDLRFTTDFRTIYAAIQQDWFGATPCTNFARGALFSLS